MLTICTHSNAFIHNIWQNSHDDAKQGQVHPVFAHTSKSASPYPRNALDQAAGSSAKKFLQTIYEGYFI